MVFLPPFSKGGQGGLYKRLIIPLNPPLKKGDLTTRQPLEAKGLAVKFKIPDPDFEKRVRGSFTRQKLMGTIGAELTRLVPGEAEISLPYRDDLTQQHGFVHAGIIATIADTACGYAAFSLMPADMAVLTVEYKINLMAPAVGELFIARGRVIRPGKTLSVCTAEVMAHHQGKAKTVATMLATMMALPNQEGLTG